MPDKPNDLVVGEVVSSKLTASEEDEVDSPSENVLSVTITRVPLELM